MSSPALDADAEHLTPPPPSPPLTEMFLRKPKHSGHSNDGSTESGSPQPSPLSNEAKQPSLPPSSPPLSSPAFDADAEHLTPPPPSPPLTEMFLRKPKHSGHSNDGSTASGSPQPSPLRNEAKQPSLPPSSPPLTEMIFQKPQASGHSNEGRTVGSSLLRNEVNEPSPTPPSPPLTEMVFPKPHASDYFKVGTRATEFTQRSPLPDEAKDPKLPPMTEMVFQNRRASGDSNSGNTATGSLQRSSLAGEAKDTIPPTSSPPMTEMVFQNRRASGYSNFGNTTTGSPPRSSLGREAKDPIPPTSSPPLTKIVFPKHDASDYFKVGTRATESSQRSPLGGEAKDPSPLSPSPPLVEMNFQKPQRSDNQDLDDEAAISSPPPRFYDAEQSIPQPLADEMLRISSSERLAPDYSDTENLSVSSLQQSSARDDGERSISPSSSPPVTEIGLPIPKSTKRNKEQLASPILSPQRLIKGTTHLPPVPPLPRPPNNTPEMAASPGMPVQVTAVAVASRLRREDLAVVAKVVGRGGASVTGVVDGAGRGGSVGWPGERGPVSATSGVDRGDARVAELGLRVGALVLSLIAFSVMAADKTQGWDGDSFERYEEYRFLVSANVIVFLYSGFQVYARFHPMIAKRQILPHRIRLYFDLLMDQILSYLLMSASSAAASRNDIWVTRFNSDKFTHRINSSVAMSFLAFIALASSTIISAYNLFKLF